MNIRKAKNNETDCLLVFNLSNDPLVRENSFNTDPILYENHIKWYEKAVNDENILFFLIFEKEDFVGQIRFSRESIYSQKCVISLSITSKYRGRHIASSFLELGIYEMKKNWKDIIMIMAEVKLENEASNKMFIREGFNLISSVNTYSRFVGEGTSVE